MMSYTWTIQGAFMRYCRSVLLKGALLAMRSKVKYPDDYIREVRSIITAAEFTFIYEDEDEGEFVVECGEDTYVLPTLDDATGLATNYILGDGPVNGVTFIPRGAGMWVPDIAELRRDINAARRKN